MGQVDANPTLFAIPGMALVEVTNVVPVMMICLFAAMVSFALFVNWLMRREFERRRTAAAPVHFRRSHSSWFEAPMRWLAVRTQNPRHVQNVLALQNPRACAWSDALAAPFEPRLFISPPVNGWVIVMGCDLPDPADDVDQCFHFLTRLSNQLGEIQFFARNRVVAHHGWARLDEGKVLRAYFWAGETLWNQGASTESERELKLHCLNYTESSEVLGLDEHELLSLNTERVVRLAGAWSIDPTSVEPAAFDANGIAGDLLHSKLH